MVGFGLKDVAIWIRRSARAAVVPRRQQPMHHKRDRMLRPVHQHRMLRTSIQRQSGPTHPLPLLAKSPVCSSQHCFGIVRHDKVQQGVEGGCCLSRRDDAWLQPHCLEKKRPARRCRFLVRLGAAALHFSDDALIAFSSGGAVRCGAVRCAINFFGFSRQRQRQRNPRRSAEQRASASPLHHHHHVVAACMIS